MNKTEINLNDPFEKSLATVLSLPSGGDGLSSDDEAVARVLRCLYTAAHGRAIQTTIGSIAIAPAVDPLLKKGPLLFKTRSDLFALVKRKTKFRQSARDQSAHFAAGSALFEFIAGRLGSAEGWPCLYPTSATSIQSREHQP